jgi:hypothetical protein
MMPLPFSKDYILLALLPTACSGDLLVTLRGHRARAEPGTELR